MRVKSAFLHNSGHKMRRIEVCRRSFWTSSSTSAPVRTGGQVSKQLACADLPNYRLAHHPNMQSQPIQLRPEGCKHGLTAYLVFHLVQPLDEVLGGSGRSNDGQLIFEALQLGVESVDTAAPQPAIDCRPESQHGGYHTQQSNRQHR